MPPYIPCPAFPVILIEQGPVEHSDGGVIIAQKANRKNYRECELRLDLLTTDELAALESVWNDGEALVVPFMLTVPGDDLGDRAYVFRDQVFGVGFFSAANRGVRSLILEDVTGPI